MRIIRTTVAGALALALAGCGEPPAPQPRMTKDEFRAAALNKTKDQIIAAYGPPTGVLEASDSWYYMDLPVYDAEAGIQADVTLQFSGSGGPEDFVVTVDY